MVSQCVSMLCMSGFSLHTLRHIEWSHISDKNCTNQANKCQWIQTSGHPPVRCRNGQTFYAIAIEGSPIQEFDFEEACEIWFGWRNHRINVVVWPLQLDNHNSSFLSSKKWSFLEWLELYAINGNVKLYMYLYCGMGYWGRIKLQYLHVRLHAKPHIP